MHPAWLVHGQSATRSETTDGVKLEIAGFLPSTRRGGFFPEPTNLAYTPAIQGRLHCLSLVVILFALGLFVV